MCRMKTSQISESINRRFFIAIDELVNLKRITSLKAFCEKFYLSSQRYREIRLTYGIKPKPNYQSRYTHIEIEALYYLCDAYSVSTEWLLLGHGKMFKNEKDGQI